MISFKFNEIDLREYGLILEEIPNIPKPGSKKEIIEIPGKDGYLSMDDTSLMPITISLNCIVTDIEQYSKIKQILTGKGKLYIPPHMDRYFIGEIIEEVVPEKIYKSYKRVILPFLCDPYSIGEIQETILTENTIINNTGTYKLKYKLEIQGTGKVRVEVNNKWLEVEVNNETITIDPEYKIFKNQEGTNKAHQVSGELFEIPPGEIEIIYQVLTGEIAETKLIYQERYV